MTRRDRCHLIGLRASRLTKAQAAAAWNELARSLEEMDLLDIPKFKHLIRAIRLATIRGCNSQT